MTNTDNIALNQVWFNLLALLNEIRHPNVIHKCRLVQPMRQCLCNYYFIVQQFSKLILCNNFKHKWGNLISSSLEWNELSGQLKAQCWEMLEGSQLFMMTLPFCTVRHLLNKVLWRRYIWKQWETQKRWDAHK